MGDRRSMISHMAKEVGISISRERVENILHEELGMSNVYARWVPRILTPDQKHSRTIRSQADLAIFDANPDGFCKRFVTENERCVYHFETETKTDDAVEAQDFSSTKGGKGGGLSRKGYGFCILGCKRHFDNRLFSERLHFINREYCTNLLRQ